MAGNIYNPSTPLIVGEEWLADLFGSWDLASEGAWAQRIRSRSAETINQLTVFQANSLPIGRGSTGGSDSAIGTGGAVILGEVIAAGSEIPTGSVLTATYQPSADQAETGWFNQAGSGVNLYQSIDEGIASVSVADYVTSSNGNYDIRFASGAFPNTARVLGVQVVLMAQSDFAANILIASLRDVIGAATYRAVNSINVVAVGAISTITIDLGEINPKTKLPWTYADIRAFSSGGYAIRLSTPAATLFSSARVYAVEMRVTYQTVENRLAAATIVCSAAATTAPGPLSTGQFVSLPAAGASWAKASGSDYTILWRVPRATLLLYDARNPKLAWASALKDGTEGSPVIPGVASAPAAVDVFGEVTSLDLTGIHAGRTLAMLLVTSAPAVSQDSLPYYLTNDTTRMPGIQGSGGVTQQFSAPATATFGFIRLLLRAGLTNASMTVKIKRVSDNVQFGNTLTVTAAQVNALDDAANDFKIVDLDGLGAALVSGTRYYVELTSAETVTFGTGWATILLGDATLAGGAATFDGTTDIASVAGVAQTHLDMPFLLAQQPAAPTGLAVTLQNVTPASFATTQNCGVATYQAARVTWNATALGASFLRYEIQRTEDHGATWLTIAHGSRLESAVAFNDEEAPIGVAVQYRVRVVRSDTIPSAWTAATPSVICVAQDCEIILASNEMPLLAVAYSREPGVESAFLAAARDQLIQIFGADYAVAFMESEDPGISFPLTLTVNFGVQPAVRDVTIWAPLRSIARAVTSYVCVKDYTGSRWYAHIQFGRGIWSEPGYSYHAEILVTEIAGSPSVAEF